MNSTIVLLLAFSAAISMAFVFPKEKCGPHAEYLECGTCNPTCEEPFMLCNRMCNEAGCYCVYPFVLHKGECIMPTECPEVKTNGTSN